MRIVVWLSTNDWKYSFKNKGVKKLLQDQVHRATYEVIMKGKAEMHRLFIF